jgi:hypothetical protein
MSCTCFDPYCIVFQEKQLMIKEVTARLNDFCIHHLFLLEDDRLRIETRRLWIWISGNKKKLSVALAVYSLCYCTVWNESVPGYVTFLFRRKGLRNKIIMKKRNLETSALYSPSLFWNLIYTTDGLRRIGNIVYYDPRETWLHAYNNYRLSESCADTLTILT